MRITPQREDHDGYYVDFQVDGLQHYLRIETAAYDVFSFFSPEAWLYFSVDRITAEQLAKGFPEYWTDSLAQNPNTSAEEAAQLHRNAAVGWLAERSFPLHDSDCWWEAHGDAIIRDPRHLTL